MLLKQFVFAVFFAAMVVCCDSDGRARDEHFTATPEEDGDKTTKDKEGAGSGAPDTENEKDTETLARSKAIGGNEAWAHARTHESTTKEP